jgi:hypothetical protein
MTCYRCGGPREDSRCMICTDCGLKRELPVFLLLILGIIAVLLLIGGHG